jgi:hypothetical protein
MKRIPVLLACLAVLVAPDAARADDADVTAAVAGWSVKISKPARELSTQLSSSSTPQEALRFLRSFTTTATRGATAIGATRSSSTVGTQVRSLARTAFLQYGAAGRLLIQAVKDVRAGKPRAVVEPKVKRAITLANTGGTKLAKAGTLIPRLVSG